MSTQPGAPEGEVYDWYQRGTDLHDQGNPAAAAQLFARAIEAEPEARSLREAFARASFDARDFQGAADAFTELIEVDPADHYAQFGLGLSLSRLGRQEQAMEPLALACAMRPDLRHYVEALTQARATVRSRQL